MVKEMVGRTERANVRSRKLNLLWKQKIGIPWGLRKCQTMTLRSQPHPCRSSYPLRLSRKNIFARMQVLIQPRPHSIWTQPKDPFHAHTPTFRVTDDAQVSSRSSGADSVAVRAHASAPTTNDAPGTVSNADATLRSADWHAPMDSSVICLKVARTDSK